MSTHSSPLPPAADDTKVCPYCAETIKAAATVCRYCGKELPPAGAAPGQPYPPQRQATMATGVPANVTTPPKKKSRWPMVLVALGVLLFGGFLCARLPATTSRTTTTGSAAAGQAALQPTFTATVIAQAAQASPAEAGTAAAPAAELATATPEPAATAAQPTAYQPGEDVTLGTLRWQVVQAVAYAQVLPSDNQFIKAATTAGSFVRVTFEVENLDNERQSFLGVDLADVQGRTFGAFDRGFMYIDTDKSCSLKSLQPNLPATCEVIFEVPADATGLTLRVTDGAIFGEQAANINLGL